MDSGIHRDDGVGAARVVRAKRGARRERPRAVASKHATLDLVRGEDRVTNAARDPIEEAGHVPHGVPHAERTDAVRDEGVVGVDPEGEALLARGGTREDSAVDFSEKTGYFFAPQGFLAAHGFPAPPTATRTCLIASTFCPPGAS